MLACNVVLYVEGILYLYRMAKLGYILKQDIVAHLLGETLDELTGGRKAIGSTAASTGNDSVWKIQLPTSTEKMLGYTRHWYDMAKEVAPIYEFVVTEAHLAGVRLSGTEVDGIVPLYVCLIDAPANTLLTDTAFFEEKDTRNPVLIEIVALMVIYNISRRTNPRQIPEQRQVDYDRAIDMLKDIQKGRVQLDIIERENVTEDDAGQDIAFGSFEGLTQQVY